MDPNLFDIKMGEPSPRINVHAIPVAPSGENLLLNSWFVNLLQIWNRQRVKR